MIDERGRRETIQVVAGDTLEAVLARMRASTADEVVLDVDERSPLLIGLEHLHRLDEAAQERGVRVVIASANSKLLNAARVFGLAVHDRRASGAEAAPDGLPFVVEPAAPTAGDDYEAERPATFAETAEEGRAASWYTWEPQDTPDAAAPAPTGEEAAVSPALVRQASAERPYRRAAQTVAPPRGARFDPYGQPYPDADEAAGDREGPDAAVGARPARAIRPLWGEPAPADRAAAAGEDEGWDEPDGVEPGERRRPRAGLTGLWAGARDWLVARRGATAATGEAPDTDDAGVLWDDDDWDTPPYRAARRPTPDPADDASGEDTGPTWPRRGQPARLVRPLRPLLVARPAAAAIEPEEDGWEQGDWQEEEEAPGAGAPRRPARRGGAGTLLAAALLLALFAAALYLFLASATVTLVARAGSAATEFSVLVAEIDPATPEGRPTAEQIVVPAERISLSVTATSSHPATGVRLEPDGVAGGPVVLTNAATEAVTVPRGTTLTALDGRTYTAVAGITVAAADPFNSGAFGTATINVAATVAGSAGNADSGTVRGRLPNGIYYNNRTSPIAGGSEREVPVLSEEDLLAARAAAEETARVKAQEALAAALPPGGAPLADTAGAGPFAVEFSAAAGAESEAVTATVTGGATMLAYRPAEVEAQARAEVERRLAAAAGAGEMVIPGSVQIAAPQLVEEAPGLLRYTTAGTAKTRVALAGDEERARLTARLARKSDAEARALLASLPGVSSFTIDYWPAWLPDRMPPRAARIDLRFTEPR